jgi:hypothetical protein
MTTRTKKPARLVRLERPLDRFGAGAIRLTCTRGYQTTSTVYACQCWAAEDGVGVAVRLTKTEGAGTDQEEQQYDVCLSSDHFDSCTCKGFQAHNFCKHTDGLRKLLDVGKLKLGR